MKRTFTVLSACALVLSLILAVCIDSGCVSVAAGSDPLVVRTEQVETGAYATFDTFLKLDDIAQSNPLASNSWASAHAFAVYLRQPVQNGSNTVPFGVGTVLSLDQVKLAYKAGTASSNALVTALAVVSTTAAQASQYSALVSTNK